MKRAKVLLAGAVLAATGLLGAGSFQGASATSTCTNPTAQDYVAVCVHQDANADSSRATSAETVEVDLLGEEVLNLCIHRATVFFNPLGVKVVDELIYDCP